MKFNKYLMMAFAVFASLALFACGDDTPTGGLDDLNGDDDNGTEEVAAIYAAGSFQEESGYGDDWTPEDAPAIYERDEDQFEAYVYFASPGEFKFTNERNWDDGDWGGSEGTLEEGGDNIAVEEGGYLKINADLGELTYATVATVWGVIGDAANGWDDDVAMEFDTEERVWSATLDLDEEGEFKFRANGAWDINYGDDDGEGDLVQDGANIPVDESGNYTIVLNLDGEDYTYEITQN